MEKKGCLAGARNRKVEVVVLQFPKEEELAGKSKTGGRKLTWQKKAKCAMSRGVKAGGKLNVSWEKKRGKNPGGKDFVKIFKELEVPLIWRGRKNFGGAGLDHSKKIKSKEDKSRE